MKNMSRTSWVLNVFWDPMAYLSRRVIQMRDVRTKLMSVYLPFARFGQWWCCWVAQCSGLRSLANMTETACKTAQHPWSAVGDTAKFHSTTKMKSAAENPRPLGPRHDLPHVCDSTSYLKCENVTDLAIWQSTLLERHSRLSKHVQKRGVEIYQT